jgi:hypothetical protein
MLKGEPPTLTFALLPDVLIEDILDASWASTSKFFFIESIERMVESIILRRQASKGFSRVAVTENID